MRSISKEQLYKILEDHKLWLNNQEGGKRADLSDTNLRYADLSGTDLRYADLRYADLRDADLSDTNLRDADLRYADLRDADLRYADLRDADLMDADLSGTNLMGADLSGTNLMGADLRDADIDYSCLTLSCKTLKIGKTDKRQCVQIAYHLLRFMDACDDPEVLKIRNIKKLIDFTNTFHRVEECGKIEKKG